MIYIWQKKEWPEFQFNAKAVDSSLHEFLEKTGLISGILKTLPEDTRMDTIVEVMVSEAIKTSEIEGEFLSRKDVMSSIKNDLGLNAKPERVADKKARGVGKLMVTVRENFREDLTEEQLFSWHRLLFDQRSKITGGAWRTHTEPMQVISGAAGKEKIHYEAPPSERVPKEMQDFIRWFNATAPGGTIEMKNAPVRAGIAHLYFETIHPFEDGNGRIGRAIAEKALSQTMGRPALLSLSRAIELNKNNYYNALKKAQRSLEVSGWVKYFMNIVLEAQQFAEDQIDFALRKTRYIDQFKGDLNERQLKVIKRMLDEGPKGFEGGMNAGKYVSLTGASKATATRDLQDLLEKQAFKLLGDGGGRSTRYEVSFE